jgi:serine/threonine protein kinase
MQPPETALASKPIEPEMPMAPLRGSRPMLQTRPSQTNHPVQSLQPHSQISSQQLATPRSSSRTGLDGLIGQVIDGEFEVVKVLGTGSHADVYLARQISLANREVALKVLSRLYMTLPEMDFRRACQALQREGQLLGELHAACFVDVYRAGALPDQRPYIALEHVEGRMLSEFIDEKQRMAPDVLLDLMRQWAEGLAELHARGWVHRDVTPRNAMVENTPYGTRRLMTYDFGTATPITGRADRFRAGWERDRPAGTASYMSPEQAIGALVDGRSDQFSLSAIAYELLTGVRAVRAEGTSAAAVLQYLRGTGPVPVQPLNALRPDLPAAVCKVIHAGMDRQPERRFDDAATFVDALSVAFQDYTPPEPEKVSLFGRFFGKK